MASNDKLTSPTNFDEYTSFASPIVFAGGTCRFFEVIAGTTPTITWTTTAGGSKAMTSVVVGELRPFQATGIASASGLTSIRVYY